MTMTKKPARKKGTDNFKDQTPLKNINKFIRAHPVMTYVQFDYYVVHDLALFSISHNAKLRVVEQQVQEIIRSLSAIMNIFNNPTIVLKDSSDVLAIEKAKVVNQNSLLHLANHSHLLSNVTDTGVKPKKLLTRVYEDDYGLYENLIFCNLIDQIINLVRRHRNFLNSLLYVERLLEFNFLEQVNHRSYFLALGKLHTGYTRNHSHNLGTVHKLLDQTQLILQTISPLLARPVYQNNLKRDKFLELRKTNIFRMQKDYRRIYKTFRFLQNKEEVIDTSDINEENAEFRRNYMRYALILTLFATGHFNFTTDLNAPFNLKSLSLPFTFKYWNLTIENTKQHEIILRFKKDKTYTMMLVDTNESEEMLMVKRRKYQVHEFVRISQTYQPYLSRDYVYISLEDINSFRRIQQILLKGMIQVDDSHRFCPFCGSQLHFNSDKNQYFCRTCMTEIAKDVCPEKNREYYFTDCLTLRDQLQATEVESNEDELTYQKHVESSFYFRNITRIDNQERILCPHCQKVHHH